MTKRAILSRKWGRECARRAREHYGYEPKRVKGKFVKSNFPLHVMRKQWAEKFGAPVEWFKNIGHLV